MTTARPGLPRSLRRLAGGVLAPAVVAGGLLLAPPVAAAAPAAGPAAAVRAAGTCASTPFRASPAQKRWFRIPSVVRTRAGTLVAFAERRDTNAGDEGNFDIVTTRSTNNGCTWAPYRVIASDAGNRVSNPSAMVDRTTGRILVFSAVTIMPGGGGKGRGLYLQTSSDDGRTFTSLLSRPVRPGGAYKGGLPGPGHAIQLSVTNPGRLVVPLGYKTSAGRYGAYGIYSDDHGATWTVGYDQLAPVNVQLIEGSIAELPSGELFITYRDKRDGAKVGQTRHHAVSKDGGTTLSAAFRRSPLNIVSVQGSALALKGTHANLLLFSAPAVTDINLRRQLSVFVSATKGATWGKRYPVELQDTPGAYSDLVQLGDNTIGVLYETGTVTWKERIAFQSIPVRALTRPTLVASRVTFERSAKPVRTTSQPAVGVTVTVAGAASPPGRVTLSWSGPRSGRTAVDLTYSNRGHRVLRLPKLPAGSYRLTIGYSGTLRIKPATVAAGTLKVVK